MCERGVLASVCFGLSGIECHERISFGFSRRRLRVSEHLRVYLDEYLLFSGLVNWEYGARDMRFDYSWK
jgi:hypothetical protein